MEREWAKGWRPGGVRPSGPMPLFHEPLPVRPRRPPWHPFPYLHEHTTRHVPPRRPGLHRRPHGRFAFAGTVPLRRPLRRCRQARRHDPHRGRLPGRPDCRRGGPPAALLDRMNGLPPASQRASSGPGSPLNRFAIPLRSLAPPLTGSLRAPLATVCVPAHKERLAARHDGRWRSPAPTPFRSPLLAVRLTLPDGGTVVLLPTYSHGIHVLACQPPRIPPRGSSTSFRPALQGQRRFAPRHPAWRNRGSALADARLCARTIAPRAMPCPCAPVSALRARMSNEYVGRLPTPAGHSPLHNFFPSEN